MFKNPFRKFYKPSEHSMQVLVIDFEADTMPASLGITEERFDELVAIMAQILKEHGNEHQSDMLAKISAHCVHPNELAMMSYALGSSVERASSPLSFIRGILGQ